MKKFNLKKGERGAIMLMSALIMTVMLGFTALTVDLGLHYYMGAKLQNAVDSAATAVASYLGSSEDGDLERVAYQYLAKNGYDKDSDRFKDKIKVDIEQRAVLNGADTLYNNEIKTGYYKLTVEVEDNTLFGKILDVDALHLKKTAYVCCKANYVDMPEALKYTVFAASTNGTDANPALQINGRTGATVNEITASFEGFINGINSKIIQPIKGIFGGTPNYNSLVNINLSEVITNGDVHSNSNISIGVQALNASRTKDQDYEGTETNSDAYDETKVDKDNSYDDYGQVTYTAVNNILFNSSLKADKEASTHIYVQNQQYLEQTQIVLNVIDTIDFSKVSSTLTLQNRFTDQATKYFENNKNVTAAQQEAVLAQAQNLVYNDDGSFVLNNQTSIVYDVSQNRAEQYLNDVAKLGIDGLVAELEKNKIDSAYGGGASLLFENKADKGGSINYGIKFVKKDESGNQTDSRNMTVTGVQVNRDMYNIYTGVAGASMTPQTQTGAKFATARTFQQSADYIKAPNMKPYFTRQVNESVKNATGIGNGDADAAYTVKQAVKNVGNDLTNLLNTVDYTDSTYSSDTALTNVNTSPLFTLSKASGDSKLEKLTGSAHTTYKGENLYDGNGILKNASDYILDYKKNHIDTSDNYGKKSVAKYYDKYIADNTSDDYETKYANDAVDKKKKQINSEFKNSYSDKEQSVKKYISDKNIPPARSDVFLGPNMSSISSSLGSFTSFAKREEYDKQMNYTISSPNLPAVNGNTVTTTKNAPWADGTYGSKTYSQNGSSSDNDITGKYYPSGLSRNRSITLCADDSQDATALVSGNIKTTSSRNLDIGGSNGKIGAPATLVVTGNIDVSNQIQLRSGSVLYCFGNINAKSLYLAGDAKVYCLGEIDITNGVYIGDNSTVTCGATVNLGANCSGDEKVEICNDSSINSTSFLTIGTRRIYTTPTSLIAGYSVTLGGAKDENVGIDCTVLSLSSITVKSQVTFTSTSVIKAKSYIDLMGDLDYKSATLNGKMYATGNINSEFVFVADSCELYCCGSFYGSNSSNTNSSAFNAIHILGKSKIYIGGHLGSKSSAERHIYIDDSSNGSGTILSVFGFEKTGLLSYDRYPFTGVIEFCNKQKDSTVYIGDGRLYGNEEEITTSLNNPFVNYGSLYFYGSLNCNSNCTFDGNGTTWFESNVTVSNRDINIQNKHTFIVEGNVKCKNLNVVDSSKCYILGALIIENGDGSINVSTDTSSGEIANLFCGTGTSLQANVAMNIDGYIYLPVQSSFTFSRLNIGANGRVDFECPVSVNNYFYIEKGGRLYSSKLVSVSNCTVTNYGTAYFMGGLDTTNSNASENVSDMLLGDASETFIGKSGDTYSMRSFYNGCGNVYIDNNLTVNLFTKAYDFVPNRAESLLVRSGNTYVSGNVNLRSSTGIYIAPSSSFSCGGDFNYGGPIYNLGTFVALGNLKLDLTADFSDRDLSNYSGTRYERLRTGITICNGGKNSESPNAVMYVGGSDTVDVGGYMLNSGIYFQNAPINILGYLEKGENSYSANIGLYNKVNAVSAFGSSVNLNSNAICNTSNSQFTCQGDLEYGQLLVNSGSFVALGKVTFNASGVEGNYGTNGFALRNGWSYESDNNEKALFYIGNGLTIGKDEPSGWGGTVQNAGVAYINGSLNIYPDASHSYKLMGFIGEKNSKTFIGGNFFSSEGTYLMTDSMFVCDGNYLTKRSTKINISDARNDVDSFASAYVYVGGNMIANKSGLPVDSAGWTNSSADFDIYSNSNVYVGGTLYANCIVCLKQNVTLAVDGRSELSDAESRNRVMNLLDKVALEIAGIDTSSFRFFANQFDQSGNMSQANTVVVRGGAYIDGVFKFRDMCKGYFYGDVICQKFAEIGKALDEANIGDNTAASTDTYKSEGDSDKNYKYANAGYMYVGGDFYTGGYNKIYAGTTMRVKGDYIAQKYLTLRHDANLYVGKKLKAVESIDGGSYSDFYIGGSMQSISSFIKLRDCTTAFVGGNLTAASYIELGKAGDYVRGDKGDAGTEGGDDGSSGSSGSNGTEEGITDEKTVDTNKELAADSTDTAKGGNFYVGKNIISYTSYIKEFAYSRIACGGIVFTPKYLTIRHNADLWVLPETFNNSTYQKKAYVSESDGTVLGDIIDSLKKLGYEISQAFAPKPGSVYTLGELTLNKNASMMGTYDAVMLGQCVLRQDSLVYMGNDFNCSAGNVNISLDSLKGNTSVVGFDSYGTTSANGYTFPVVVYADNNINISTTMEMKLTYLVANRGNVNLYDIYSKSENAENNAKQLPNAVCSYQGNINYFAMYGKIGALFYCPRGNLNLDGYYSEIWGSCIGNTVEMNAYYLSLHRFTNWRTMQLKIAESGSVYLISEKEYSKASVDPSDYYLYNEKSNNDSSLPDGAKPFY